MLNNDDLRNKLKEEKLKLDNIEKDKLIKEYEKWGAYMELIQLFEINLAGEKRLLVFPNRLKCVRKRKLNLSAPCPRGGRRRAAQTFGTASLRDLVILLRSISYPAISPSLIPSVKLPSKFSSPLLHYIVGNNSGLFVGQGG